MSLQEKLERVIKAALDGPAIKDISIKGHEFNVDRVKREITADGRIIIDGRGDGDNISHRRTFASDDQVNYGFTVKVDNTGVDITNISVEIKEGGLLATWGVPIVAVINLWDEIECFFDDEQEFADCDIIGLVKALYNAVKRNTSDFDVDEANGISLAELENQNMSWEEVAELMILSIASGVVGNAIARAQPDWIKKDTRIKVVAPDFDDNQEAVGVNVGIVRNIGLGVGFLLGGGAGTLTNNNPNND